MTSLTAGSPTCNCKNPDSCIHAFTLKVNDRSFTYKQNQFVKVVDAIDEGEKGVPLSLSLTGKGCVSHNPQCPQGIFYNAEKAGPVEIFTQGVKTWQGKFDTSKSPFFNTIDAVDFLMDYVVADHATDVLPKSTWVVCVGQCSGEPFANKSVSFADGASQSVNTAPRDALQTNVNIYPEYEWEASVKFGYSESVEEYTDKELRAQQTQQNRANGNPQRKYRGWTRRERFSISNLFEMEGKLSCKMGSLTHEYAPTFKSDFQRKAHRISWLNNAFHTVDKLTENLTTNEGNNAEIRMINTEVIFPAIEIKGAGELKEDDAKSDLYIEKEYSVSLAPLIGMKITVDLLQAFAAWYRADILLAAVREGLMRQEQANSEGKNSAFIGMTFNLSFEGAVDLKLSFKTNADHELEWQKDDAAEVKVKLIIEANLRAGVRFYIAEGSLEIGGIAETEGCMGLHSPSNDRLDLVFYHNGITAKVYVSYTVGLSSDSQDLDNEGGGLSSKSSMSRSSDQAKKSEKEWIIYDELEKEKSTCRVRLY